MTVATNALLERRGARTALVTTEGFRDVIEIGRQDRPALYDLAERRPAPLVPRELRFTVRERMGPDGELEPLDEDSVARGGRRRCARPRSRRSRCACCSRSCTPSTSAASARRCARRCGDVHVSLSSEVLPEFREYERFSTTVADAYLGAEARRLPRAAGRRRGRGGRAGAAGDAVLGRRGRRRRGGARRPPAACSRGRPAAWSARRTSARASGFEDVLTFDMGGTSTDVAPVVGGEAQTTTESVVAGVPIKLPMVDVHTVSAGGGSIAWADAGGALRVGPRSAGADPGPAAYGRGGEEPTVTDANLLLGYLGDGAELGGE